MLAVILTQADISRTDFAGALKRALRVVLVFLLSTLLSLAAPIPASVPALDNRLNAEDLAYFLWERGNSGKFWEVETAKTPFGLKRLQDRSGISEVMELEELPLPHTPLRIILASKLPLAGFRTYRGYAFALASAFLAEGKFNEAAARYSHGGVGAATTLCPFGTDPSHDNYCSTSPGGSFQVANFFTGYTGTSYPARPAYNVESVDFPGGVPAVSDPTYSFTLGGITVTGSCGLDHIQDPKTASTGASDDPGCGVLPAHCAYHENVISDQLTVSQVYCHGAGANDIVLRGFDQSPTGGHDATYFLFDNDSTGRKVLAFNRHGAGPDLYYQNSFGSFESGSQGNAILFADSFFGHWVDSYSAQGSGSCSFAGTAMSCTGDTGFAVGMAVDATGLTNSPVISRVNGSGSYTLNNAQSTLSARSTLAFFIMGGGMGIYTTGSVIARYIASTQVNGRDITTQANTQVLGTPLTIADSLNQANFWEGAIYRNFTYLGQVHFETIEYTLANAAHPVTYTNLSQSSNVCYVPTIAASVTACFWNHTGAISPSPTGGDFIVNYINVTVDRNIVVANIAGTQALTGIGADNRPGGGPVTNFTLTNNWVHKSTSGTYSGCSGDPYLVGNTGQPVSFMHASDNGAGDLNVDTFQGGVPIDYTSGTMIVSESHGRITGYTSGGTPGGAGHYSVVGDISKSATNMRAAYPEILNVPVISGNIDLPSGDPISTANMILRADNTHPCVYSGMQ